MTSNEAALRALRVKGQFEVARAAAAVAQATRVTMLAQRRASATGQRCTALADELRGLMQRPPIDPPLLETLQRLHRAEQLARCDLQMQLAGARSNEVRLRNTLAEARNRERSLERALRAERHRRQLQRLSRELLEADELWLQHVSRHSP